MKYTPFAIAVAAAITLSACSGTSEAQESVSTTEAPESTPFVTEAPTTTQAPTTVPAPAVSYVTVPPPSIVTVPPTEAPTTTQPVTFTVTNVVDGDTVDVTGSDGGQFRVRVIGIDTPEMDTCEGPEATKAAVFILQGKQVELLAVEGRDDTDRYGRYLRHITVDGVDYGLTMINLGQAIARYDSRDGYGTHQYEEQYHAADDATPNYTCPVATTPAPRPTTTPAPAPVATPAPPSNDVYYKNCDAVRAAGAAPIYAGDPGFQSKFDRDGDGVGCE